MFADPMDVNNFKKKPLKQNTIFYEIAMFAEKTQTLMKILIQTGVFHMAIKKQIIYI